MGTNKCESKCKTCRYFEYVHGADYGCFYILYDKKSRGCDPKDCDKWEPKTKKDAVQMSLNLALGERGLLG